RRLPPKSSSAIRRIRTMCHGCVRPVMPGRVARFHAGGDGDSQVVKKRLSDQVIVVTGASSGLGRATARLAGARGAKVVVTARSGEALDACVREVEAAGSEALAVPADCTVQDEVAQVVEQAVDRFGRVDTYVANAIVTVYAETYRYEPDELRRVMDVNFFGQVYGYWAALPHLRASRGTFLSINSALAYRGIPLQGAYCASKAALRAFFESARVEIRKEGWDVAVSVILPGGINKQQYGRNREQIREHAQTVARIARRER